MEAYQVVDENGEDAEGLYEGNLAIFFSRVEAHNYMDYLVHDIGRNEAFKVREVKVTQT